MFLIESEPTERHTVCPIEVAVPPLVWFGLKDCSPKLSLTPKINGDLSFTDI